MPSESLMRPLCSAIVRVHGAGGTRNCVEVRTQIALGWVLGRAVVIGTSHCFSFGEIG